MTGEFWLRDSQITR